MLKDFNKEVEKFEDAMMQSTRQKNGFGLFGGRTDSKNMKFRQEVRSLGRYNHGLLEAIREYERRSKYAGQKVFFNGVPLTSNSATQTFTLLHRGDKQPEATILLSGFEDTPVQVEMFHVMGRSYGGHLHQIAAKYLGEFRSDPPGRLASNPAVGRATMILLPREKEFTIIYKASDVCTRRKIRVNSVVLQQPIEFLVDVKYAVQLYDLYQYDTPNLELYTGDDVHPEEVCHYGTKKMVDALVAIDRAFGEAKENGDLPADTPKIKVNDMSLPWGGALRSYGKMEKTNKEGKLVTNSHKTHKWGMDVDISYKAMTSKQKAWFKKEASKHFTTVDTHSKGDSQQHWHLDL